MGRLVKFGNSRIQKLNRVALGSALVENLDLKIGYLVGIYFDADSEKVIISSIEKIPEKKYVKFGKCKIQKLFRVVFPSSLLENLKLEVGSEVKLFFDVDNQEIVIEKIRGENEK